MTEEDKDFERVWLRDGKRVVQESANLKDMAAYFFAQGRQHGEDAEMRSAKYQVTNPNAATVF